MTYAETTVRRLLDGLAGRDWDLLANLYADVTDVRHPLAAVDRPLRSRDELRAHFQGQRAALADRFDIRPANIRIHQTLDPELIIAEFDYCGTCLATDVEVAAPCVFVVRVQDGLIVSSRDYIDEGAFRRAAGAPS